MGFSFFYYRCLSSGNLYNSIQTSSSQTWDQRLGVEVVLTFVIVFTYFVSTNSHRRIFGNSAVMIGAAYSACTLVYVSFKIFQFLSSLFSVERATHSLVCLHLTGKKIVDEKDFNKRRSLKDVK
jgi:hypothetical protein